MLPSPIWFKMTQIYPMGRRKGRKEGIPLFPKKQCSKTVSIPPALSWSARSGHVVIPTRSMLVKVAGPSWIQLKTPLELSIPYIHSHEENPTWWWKLPRTAEPINSRRNETRPNLTYSLPLSFSVDEPLLFLYLKSVWFGVSVSETKSYLL